MTKSLISKLNIILTLNVFLPKSNTVLLCKDYISKRENNVVNQMLQY